MARSTAWRRRPKGLLFAAVALLLGAAVAPSRADDVPAGATWTQHYFPSTDGTQLHADVFLPEGLQPGERVPVILMVTPYAGTGGILIPDPTQTGPAIDEFALAGLLPRFLERGYAFVQVSLRGYGASGGCSDLGGKGEQGDAYAAVEWAAAQPWSTGDVGMFGGSYTGFTQIMALAMNPPHLRAVVMWAPVATFYDAMFVNRVHHAYAQYGTGAGYQLIDVTPPSVNSDPAQHTNALTDRPECNATRALIVAEQYNSDPNSAFWRERDLVTRAKQTDVPVLWTQGFLDKPVKPQNGADLYRALTSPKRAWVGQWIHRSPGMTDEVGIDGFNDEALRWYDRWVRGLPEEEAPVGRDPDAVIQQADGRWRTERAWPPKGDGTRVVSLLPGTYTDAAGNKGDTTYDTEAPWGDVDFAQDDVVGADTRTGNGSWTFTPTLAEPLHLTGYPVLEVDVDTVGAPVHLIAFAYDVAPDGTASLISRGAYAVPGDGRVSFELYPQDWPVAAGHRIGVLLSGADDNWFTPGTSGTTVTVTGGSLTFTVVEPKAKQYLDGGPSTDMDLRGPIQVAAEEIAARTGMAPEEAR